MARPYRALLSVSPRRRRPREARDVRRRASSPRPGKPSPRRPRAKRPVPEPARPRAVAPRRPHAIRARSYRVRDAVVPDQGHAAPRPTGAGCFCSRQNRPPRRRPPPASTFFRRPAARRRRRRRSRSTVQTPRPSEVPHSRRARSSLARSWAGDRGDAEFRGGGLGASNGGGRAGPASPKHVNGPNRPSTTLRRGLSVRAHAARGRRRTRARQRCCSRCRCRGARGASSAKGTSRATSVAAARTDRRAPVDAPSRRVRRRARRRRPRQRARPGRRPTASSASNLLQPARGRRGVFHRPSATNAVRGGVFVVLAVGARARRAPRPSRADERAARRRRRAARGAANVVGAVDGGGAPAVTLSAPRTRRRRGARSAPRLTAMRARGSGRAAAAPRARCHARARSARIVGGTTCTPNSACRVPSAPPEPRTRRARRSAGTFFRRIATRIAKPRGPSARRSFGAAVRAARSCCSSQPGVEQPRRRRDECSAGRGEGAVDRGPSAATPSALFAGVHPRTSLAPEFLLDHVMLRARVS